MNLNKTWMVLSLLICTAILVQAQRFSPAFHRFSNKKTSYITLEDGTEIQGTVKDFDWKKGQVKKIKVEDMNGKKVKLKPEQIKHMYVVPNAFSKLETSMDFLTDAQQWDGNNDLDKDIIGKGYVYLEKTSVRIKKKTFQLIMQLVNPTVAGKIKVYHDPLAKEAASLGIGGVKVVGGEDKSYYIKKDQVAYRLKKKDYDEEFMLIFKDCPALIEKYGDNPKWMEFEKHIFEYAELCK